MRISDWSSDVCSSDLLILGMLQEVFDVYVMKPLRKRAPQCLRWMRSVLQQYKRPFLTDEEINEMKLNRLWNLVQVCGRLAVRTTVRRSEEHTSELQSLMRISYAVFCLKKKTHILIESPNI